MHAASFVLVSPMTAVTVFVGSSISASVSVTPMRLAASRRSSSGRCCSRAKSPSPGLTRERRYYPSSSAFPRRYAMQLSL